ncbi:chemotaxis protein CheY [Ectothiorhodospira haloalkaliphila]|uniref:Chemotaxis protein CheY n=1 Tax=Ectothiorhodospira haloalkaliphila TaxID=421628 RepID=W8KQP3_9GAMM|nr:MULTISPECIES: LytTR family DNA-binding domain-containing protein [Ectothiorhodospira]AHK77881.1 chemotaxis protein CheY [Ectothiorhodospira haloalkaliphila]MCG5494200.1 LytTR family DNA-binding domain-containing protein [Ectothiorhodospira variabilis]MCG5496366.1 LytTR family DNA-binding domain-containing protein [Ectothiorhodospira variabilis]MCG5504854.1 LytTR family DNA-binding domain-containing protein [Ectothiorhodospira variabilis]MCG5508011.1 LytTR family DNA-binding domain-containin
MKVLIVDDEQPARERLASLLERMPDYEVVANASNGLQAVRLAQQLEPDIVLLDIRMPGMDGLEAASHIAEMETPPAVIFITAYEGHAIEAFETHAVGYLLKPVRQERLQEALEQAGRPNRAQLGHLQDSTHQSRTRSHICARVRGNLELIPVESVHYFQADQKYVTVRHDEGEVLIEEPLKALEEEFGEDFLRIHRNALVAKSRFCGMEKNNQGGFEVVLKDSGERLEVSRRHVAEVRRFLKTL